jgi:hypothetical protein
MCVLNGTANNLSLSREREREEDLRIKSFEMERVTRKKERE